MVQLKVILDTRKIRADGTYSIYFRITEFKKVFYFHSGFTIQQQYWNDQEKKVLKSHIQARTINASISKKHFELHKAIIELEDEGLFSIERLKEKLNTNSSTITFKNFSDKVIEEMKVQNRTGNAIVYQTGVNSIFRFKHSLELRFTDISVSFLENYISYLSSIGCKVNTIGNYLRTIRAIYNKAIRAKIVDRKFYPFSELTIKTERTAKRAYSKEVIRLIREMELSNSKMEIARDYYMLSFYLIGINFTDLAYLTKGNIIDGRIEFKRRKTGTFYSITILPQAKEILFKYSQGGNKYLLPILPNSIDENGLVAKKIIQQWIKTTNKYLKRISAELSLSKECTTYTVRHSWATIAKRLGYSKELIGEAMGHKL